MQAIFQPAIVLFWIMLIRLTHTNAETHYI